MEKANLFFKWLYTVFKKQPEKLAKNLGKLSAIYEYKIYNTPNLKNEDCLTYMELSPRSFF